MEVESVAHGISVAFSELMLIYIHVYTVSNHVFLPCMSDYRFREYFNSSTYFDDHFNLQYVQLIKYIK